MIWELHPHGCFHSERSSDREDEKKPSGFFELGLLIRTARRRRIAKQFFEIDHPAAWK
jgi:hypothetical protein